MSSSDHSTALSPTEQLYTARGSQGFGTYKDIVKHGVDPDNYEDVVMIDYYQDANRAVNFLLRPIFTTTRKPDYIKFVLNTGPFGIIQIPLWLQITDSSMDELPLRKVLIQMHDPND